ncbi:MAG: hypothetical protein SGCHY_004752 [Lobulomycetales sp.]
MPCIPAQNSLKSISLITRRLGIADLLFASGISKIDTRCTGNIYTYLNRDLLAEYPKISSLVLLKPTKHIPISNPASDMASVGTNLPAASQSLARAEAVQGKPSAAGNVLWTGALSWQSGAASQSSHIRLSRLSSLAFSSSASSQVMWPSSDCPLVIASTSPGGVETMQRFVQIYSLPVCEVSLANAASISEDPILVKLIQVLSTKQIIALARFSPPAASGIAVAPDSGVVLCGKNGRLFAFSDMIVQSTTYFPSKLLFLYISECGRRIDFQPHQSMLTAASTGSAPITDDEYTFKLPQTTKYGLWTSTPIGRSTTVDARSFVPTRPLPRPTVNTGRQNSLDNPWVSVLTLTKTQPSSSAVVSAGEFEYRQLVPSLVLNFNPIPRIPLLTPRLYSTCLDAFDATNGSAGAVTDSNGVSRPPDRCWGFISIDQTRHILPLTRDDPMSQKLPLIGIWIYNDSNADKQQVIHTQWTFDRVFAYIRNNDANHTVKKLPLVRDDVCVCMIVSPPPFTPIVKSSRGNARLDASPSGRPKSTGAKRIADFYEVHWHDNDHGEETGGSDAIGGYYAYRGTVVDFDAPKFSDFHQVEDPMHDFQLREAFGFPELPVESPGDAVEHSGILRQSDSEDAGDQGFILDAEKDAPASDEQVHKGNLIVLGNDENLENISLKKTDDPIVESKSTLDNDAADDDNVHENDKNTDDAKNLALDNDEDFVNGNDDDDDDMMMPPPFDASSIMHVGQTPLSTIKQPATSSGNHLLNDANASSKGVDYRSQNPTTMETFLMNQLAALKLLLLNQQQHQFQQQTVQTAVRRSISLRDAHCQTDIPIVAEKRGVAVQCDSFSPEDIPAAVVDKGTVDEEKMPWSAAHNVPLHPSRNEFDDNSAQSKTPMSPARSRDGVDMISSAVEDGEAAFVIFSSSSDSGEGGNDDCDSDVATDLPWIQNMISNASPFKMSKLPGNNGVNLGHGSTEQSRLNFASADLPTEAQLHHSDTIGQVYPAAKEESSFNYVHDFKAHTEGESTKEGFSMATREGYSVNTLAYLEKYNLM